MAGTGIIGGVKRRRGILLAVVAFAFLALLVAVVWPRESQPEYQGKKLSEWLSAYSAAREGLPSYARMSQAINAVRHIGTNGLPLLVKWLDYDPPKWRTRFANAIIRVPGPVPRESMANWILGSRALRASIAPIGFELLGEDAAPAVPALAQLVGDCRYPARADGALVALMLIGKAGLPALLSVVTNQVVPTPYRCKAADFIGMRARLLGTNALCVVPILVQCLDDTTTTFCVANVLGKLRLAPEEVVPALVRCLRSTNSWARAGAAQALGEFDSEASSAVPALLVVASDNDQLVRSLAAGSLRKIAPQVLTNAAH